MTATTTDPVCGMVVDPDESMSEEYDGQTYFFCESVCLETFHDEPERWAMPATTPEAPSPASAAQL